MTLTSFEKNLHQQFSDYGLKTKEWINKCKFLLLEIDKKKIWKKKGFSSIHEYAAKLAGLSRFQVDDALRILRKIEEKPALMEVAKEKGLNCVRPVITIVKKEDEAFWAEKASQMSKHALQTYVSTLRRESHPKEFGPGTGVRISPGTDVYKLGTDVQSPGTGVHISPNSTGSPKPPCPKTKCSELKLPADLVEKLQKIPDLEAKLREFIKQEKEILEESKPKPVKTESRHIPAEIKRHSLKRSNGLCAYPGCTKPYKILHHTQRFALEKIHDPDQIVPLCKGHEQIAHHNLIQNEQAGPEKWQLRRKPDKNSPEFWIDQQVQLFRQRSLA